MELWFPSQVQAAAPSSCRGAMHRNDMWPLGPLTSPQGWRSWLTLLYRRAWLSLRRERLGVEPQFGGGSRVALDPLYPGQHLGPIGPDARPGSAQAVPDAVDPGRDPGIVGFAEALAVVVKLGLFGLPDKSVKHICDLLWCCPCGEDNPLHFLSN